MSVDLASLRDEFPVTEAWAYLDHASYGPFSRRTAAAIEAVVGFFTHPETMPPGAHDAAVETARRHVAALVGGVPERVAFVGSLADAMSLCAAGIDWRPGDNVVIPREEFPSNVYPFLNLERLGVEVRLVAKGAGGFTDLERVAAAIDGRTRALVISHVEFMTGFRNDLDAVGRLCRERGVLSLVDATQSLGPLPIDVAASGIDVVAAHGYKWLMASFGVGVIHFSERALAAIRPVYAGRAGVVASWDELDYTLEWQPGAARFQTGGINWLGIAALNASAELIRLAQPARIEAHTLALTERLLDAVAERGYQVTSCREPAHRSQIVSFTTGDPAADEALVQALRERRMAVTLRGRGVRVSPYFYNTVEEIDRLVEALPRR